MEARLNRLDIRLGKVFEMESRPASIMDTIVENIPATASPRSNGSRRNNFFLSFFISFYYARVCAKECVLPDNGCTYTYVFTVDANATHYYTHFHL